MPARSDTNGDELRLIEDMDLDAAHTIMVWAVNRATVPTNACIISLSRDGGAADRYWIIQASGETMTMYLNIAGSNNTITGPDLTSEDNNWFCYVMTYDAPTVRYQTRKFDATSFTVHGDLSPTADPRVMGHVLLGEDPFGDHYWNGSWAALKIWEGAAVLTDAEIERESRFYTPQRTADLFMWNPLLVGDEWQDMSGNGRDLTEAGSVVADQDGPPIPWAPARHRLLVPAAVAAAPDLVIRRRQLTTVRL